MPEKYQDYLAANVLNQASAVSYRSLSRAVKAHINTAKEMLYEFHSTQNAKKPGSVHATYLICGTRKPHPTSQPNGNHHADGDDTLMSDSSFMMSSSMPGQEDGEEVESIPVTTVTLVPEEQLDEIKGLYEKINSIHIYSLEPGPLKNIHILSDCNRKIAVDYASEDPLETWKQYGTIHNPNTTRRSGRRPPPPAPATSVTPATKAAPQPKPADAAKPATTKSASAKPPQPKRESSDIFKSFAKSKNEPAKEQRTGAHQGAPGSLGPSKPEPPTAEDTSMKDIPDVPSDDDDDDGDVEQEESEEAAAHREAESAAAKEKAEANRRSKLEREAKLREMMDEDDDNDDEVKKEADADEDEPMADTEADADAEEEDQADDAPIDAVPQPKTDDEQPHVTVSDGRRRGRRRVMKKKTVKDAEGYLVTREEPVWESFSEDEPAAPTPAAKSSAMGGGKMKKSTAKPGQGNIMSFFGKK